MQRFGSIAVDASEGRLLLAHVGHREAERKLLGDARRLRPECRAGFVGIDRAAVWRLASLEDRTLTGACRVRWRGAECGQCCDHGEERGTKRFHDATDESGTRGDAQVRLV